MKHSQNVFQEQIQITEMKHISCLVVEYAQFLMHSHILTISVDFRLVHYGCLSDLQPPRFLRHCNYCDRARC